MAKRAIPRTPMNELLRKAVRRFRTLTPEQRARLLVQSGAVPPEEEAAVRDRLASAKAARAAG